MDKSNVNMEIKGMFIEVPSWSPGKGGYWARDSYSRLEKALASWHLWAR